MMNGETYLGDGLYASFDGFHVTLRAPRDNGDHYVFLEPATMHTLVGFMCGLHQQHGGVPIFMALRSAILRHADVAP